MDHAALKMKLIEACRSQQQKMIENLSSVIQEAQQSANDYGPPRDRYDSYRMQLLRKKDMYAQQLEKALTEVYALEKIDCLKKLDKIGFGSVIILNDQQIFISISAGKVQLDGETYLAVSLNVPLSQVFVGKRKGDVVEFNGKKMEIIDTF